MTIPVGDFLKRQTDAVPDLDDLDTERDDQLAAALGPEVIGGAPRPAAPAGPDETAPIPGGGYLLEADARAVFKAIDKTVRRQQRLARNRDEAGKHWDRVVAGNAFSFLEKSEDRSVWKAVVPPGVDEDSATPVPNKVADLRNKIVSQVLADAPLPNPKADGDGDRARAAADLTKKFLRADGTASGTDDVELLRHALTLAMTRQSAFLWAWVDKTAGGWRPKQIKADPQAVDPAFPFVGPGNVKTGDPVLRYVAEVEDPATGEVRRTFTKDPAAAARLWLPKIRAKVLHPNHVRTVPSTATVFNAEKIILVTWEPLCEAKRRFTALQTMTDVELRQLAKWRPKDWQRLVPPALRQKGAMEDGDDLADDTPIFWYHVYCEISPDYVDGGEVAVSGANDGTVLLRDTLRDDVELEDGTMVPVLRTNPLSQLVCKPDIEGEDPMGQAGVADFGGGNELLAHLLVAILDNIDRGLNRNVFIPSTSPVEREDLNRRDGTPIPVLHKDDQPFYEEVPQLPAFTIEVLDRIEGQLNSAAGTNETSNGLDSAYSISGEAKKVAIRQAKVALAWYWTGAKRCLTRFWQVKTQLAQGRLTVPQIVQLTGEDAAYKQRWWIGADLVGVNEVALEPGSFTMMAPQEKASWLSALQQAGWIDPQQAAERARATMSDDLGLPKSVHEERIDRAIADFLDGPPSGWMETWQANQQAQAAYEAQIAAGTQQLAGATGMLPEEAAPVAQTAVQPPQLQPLWNPFQPRPNDEEPAVAKIQQAKLSRVISTPDYTKHPEPWRQLLDAKYAAACYAAGVLTARQQYEQQQRQALEQQQAAATAAAGEQANKDADRTAQAQEADKNRAHASQEAAAADQRKLTHTLAGAAAQAATAPAPTPAR